MTSPPVVELRLRTDVASGRELDDVTAVAAQLPAASSLVPGTPVVVFGEAADFRRFWQRVFGPRPVRITRAARCGALIVRGYVDVGAGIDAATRADIAWGKAPS